MKTTRLLCALLILTASFWSATAEDQMASLTSSYTVASFDELLATIPVEAFVRGSRHYGSSKVYPIGFSQDGKLAYLAYMTNPQYISWEFVILDLVEDAITYKQSGEPHDEVTSPMEFFNSMQIVEELHKNGIHLAESPILPSPFPLEYEGDVYTAELIAQDSGGDETLVDKQYAVRLISRNRGSKTLAKLACSPYPEPTITGYLLSPFERRAAVVVMYDIAFAEGESSGSFAVTGGSLRVGFRK